MKRLMMANAAVVMGAFVSTGAHAADPVIYEPAPAATPVAAAYDWSGLYIGGQGGYGWGDADNEYSLAIFEIDSDISGGFVGIYSGWNWQFGRFVVGVDADIGYSGIDGTGTNGVESLTTKLNWTGALRGRVAYAYDRMLIYAAGGLAFADTDVRFFDDFQTLGSASDTLTGWTIGGGADVAFSDNLIGRVEYRYSDYGEISYVLIGEDSSIKAVTHTVLVGIAYKF